MELSDQLLVMETEISVRRRDEELKLDRDSDSPKTRVSKIRQFLSDLISFYKGLPNPWDCSGVSTVESLVLTKYAYWRESLPEGDRRDFPDGSKLVKKYWIRCGC